MSNKGKVRVVGKDGKVSFQPKELTITTEPGNVPEVTGLNVQPMHDSVIGKEVVTTEEPQSEKTIEGDILHWLNSQKDCFAFKVNTVGIWDERNNCYRKTGLFTLKGTSDILGIWKGKPLAIEVKNKLGQLTTEQHAFINKFRLMGGISFKAEALSVVKRNLEYYDKHGTIIVS